MSSPLVSIIVPVWNTAQFLPECLDSLLGQTLHDIEIICVDDASTDDSLPILERYAAQDLRVRVLSHETNRGPGAARNLGIDAAHGIYIGFVDSDDRISSDFYLNLYQAAVNHNSDITITRCTVYDDSTASAVFGGSIHVIAALKLRWVHNIRGMAKAFGPAWYDNRDFSGERAALSAFPSVVDKLYRRSLFDTVRFPEGVLFEDLLFMPQMIHYANRIYSCPGGMYYYRRNPASITRRTGFDDLLQKLAVAGALDRWVQQQTLKAKERRAYEELVRRKYRQGITSLVKKIVLWSPERLRAVTGLVPEAMVSLFYRRLFCRWSLPTVALILIVWFAVNVPGR